MTMNLPRGNEVDVGLGQQIIMWTRGNACPGAIITFNFLKVWHGLPCWTFRCHGLITWLQVLNHDLLFSAPCCFLLDGLIKEATCNVMVDHLQSRVTPSRQYASHVKVRGTLSKIDVPRGSSLSRVHVNRPLFVYYEMLMFDPSGPP